MSSNQIDPFGDNNLIDDDFQIDDDINNHNINESSFIQPDVQSKINKPQSQSHSIPSIQSNKTYEGGFFSLNYYRQYFDLNTNQFFSNCLRTLNPISVPNADEFNHNGDLYGSVWITASLIFLLFFCNSFASLLSGWFLGIDLDSLNINYFKMIVSSINLLYAYTLIIPLFLYLILKYYLKVLILVPLTKLISIYSYANLLWVPAVLLSIFRGLLVNLHTLDSLLKWGCILVGAVLSGCSIIYKLNFYFNSIFGNDDKKSAYIILSILAICHLGFSIGVKVCFFGKL